MEEDVFEEDVMPGTKIKSGNGSVIVTTDDCDGVEVGEHSVVIVLDSDYGYDADDIVNMINAGRDSVLAVMNANRQVWPTPKPVPTPVHTGYR